MSKISFIESLLDTSSLDCEKVSEIKNQLNNITEEQADDVINRLRDLQLDPIVYGSRYTQTDIKKQ